MSDPIASENEEERNEEDEDLEDLEEDSSGGESGLMSRATGLIAEMAMSKEWTRGLVPADTDTGRPVRIGQKTGWVCCDRSIDVGETPDGGEGGC